MEARQLKFVTKFTCMLKRRRGRFGRARLNCPAIYNIFWSRYLQADSIWILEICNVVYRCAELNTLNLRWNSILDRKVAISFVFSTSTSIYIFSSNLCWQLIQGVIRSQKLEKRSSYCFQLGIKLCGIMIIKKIRLTFNTHLKLKTKRVSSDQNFQFSPFISVV